MTASETTTLRGLEERMQNLTDEDFARMARELDVRVGATRREVEVLQRMGRPTAALLALEITI